MATESPARSPIPSTRSPRRSRPVTAAGSRSCSRSGRPATARARMSSTSPPRSTPTPTAESASAAPTTTPASTSAARSRARRPRRRPGEFLAHVRAGRAEADGKQGSAAKWTHAAIALATRSLLGGEGEIHRPAPDAILRLIERVVGEGGARSGADGGDFDSADAAALLHAWLDSVGLPSRPRPDPDDAGGGLLPLAASSGAPEPRTTRGCGPRRPGPRVAPGGEMPSLGAARRGLRRLHAGRPLPALDRVPRARASEARGTAQASPAGSLSSPTASTCPTASRTRSSASASSASTSTRSRSSAPIAASTAGCRRSRRSRCRSTRASTWESHRCPAWSRP